MNKTTKDEMISTVHFHIKGTGFEATEGYDLKYLLSSLNSVETLIEKTYKYISKKERLTSSDRKNLNIKITDIKPGSFQADLQIILGTVILPLTPILQQINDPKKLWKLITQSYKYVHDLLQARSKGETVKMEVNDSNGTISIVNEGNGSVNVYPLVVPNIAKHLSPNFNELNKLISKNGPVSNIEIGSETKSDNSIIQVNKDTSKIFVKQTYLDENPQEVFGTIYKIDATKLTGNIEINIGSNLINPGKYKFSFMDTDEVSVSDIKSILMTSTKFKCFAKEKLDPATLKEEVIEIKIIKIDKEEVA